MLVVEIVGILFVGYKLLTWGSEPPPAPPTPYDWERDG